MSKEALKQKIDETIYENLEGDIGGESLNEILNDIVDEIPEANPTGEATETLGKIKIGETIYTAPQGPQGEQGPQGFPGTPGTPGQPGANAFVYIKYAAESPTSDNDMHDTPQAGDKWMGVYSGSSATAPTTYTSYKWSKYVGEGGGADIFDSDVLATDSQRLQALANVSNQTVNSTTGKMGYVVLQPEKAGDAATTFAAQIADKSNTIIEIRDIYTLTSDVSIPDGCVLKFNGGMIVNSEGNTYKVNLGTAKIEAPSRVQVFKDVKVYSTAYAPRLDVTWFGFSTTNTPANNKAIFEMILSISALQNKRLCVYIPTGEYTTNGISYGDENTSVYLDMRGEGQNKTILRISPDDTESLYLFQVVCAYTRIHDITFRGNTYNWTKNQVMSNPNTNLFALFKPNGFDVWVYQCGFNACSNHGVFIDHCNAIMFEDCRFTYNFGCGALVLYNRGTSFKDAWCELNYMGGIMHTVPYKLNSYGRDNMVNVYGGNAENNGIFGRKGSALNYKDEEFEYQTGFFIMEDTPSDYFENKLSYNTSLNSYAAVLKPIKRKYVTLDSDTTLQFKDSQWNDLIIYKRDDTFAYTFDKNFLAGDTIYLYDWQQNVTNELEWTEEIVQSMYEICFNTIISSGESKGIVKIDDNLQQNYSIIGGTKVTDRDLTKPHLIDFQETNLCPFTVSSKSGTPDGLNPIFPNLVYYHNQDTYNPVLYRSSLLNPDGSAADTSDVWLYFFGRSNKTVKFTYAGKLSNVKVYDDKCVLANPNGDYCVEVRLGNIGSGGSKEASIIQLNVKSDWCYGAILSTKRFPKFNAGFVYCGKTNNRPTGVPVGYQYFDTQLHKPIWSDGNGGWYDATGTLLT